jgi:hypothetical protein
MEFSNRYATIKQVECTGRVVLGAGRRASEMFQAGDKAWQNTPPSETRADSG